MTSEIKKINNKEDWQKFYYYAPEYMPKKYPKSYPCFAKRESEGGGLGGEYESHYVVYPPFFDLNTDSAIQQAFEAGLNAKWEYVC